MNTKRHLSLPKLRRMFCLHRVCLAVLVASGAFAVAAERPNVIPFKEFTR